MQSHVPLAFLSATSDTTFFRFVKEQTAFKLFGQKPKLSTTPVLSFRFWWRMTGSNRRPPACKAGALPAELIPLPVLCLSRALLAYSKPRNLDRRFTGFR